MQCTSRNLTVGIVDAVLLVLNMLRMNRRAMIVVGAVVVLFLGACASEGAEQAQVVSVAPTSVSTTAPLSLPTATPVPAPTSTALPQVTATPLPTPVPTPLPPPTVAPATAPTATAAPAPSPTTASDVEPAPTTPEPTALVETPTPVPTPTTEALQTDEDSADPDSDSDVGATSTPEPATPTVVVAVSGEPPLECFDTDVQVYRAYVDGVDALSFEGGNVRCSGAGRNAVSAARSYRHSSGLVVQRNANYIFNEAGTAYIPFSGVLHFCIDGQPASAPVRSDRVPTLLVVIDSEALRQVAQGASGPAGFTGSTQC